MDKLARELELLEVDAAGSRVARLRDGERALLLEAFPQVPTHLRTNNKCQSRRARAASSRPPRLRGSSVSLHCHLPQLLFPAVGAGKSKCRRLGWGDCSWEGGKLRAAPGAQAATSFFSQLPASDLARGDSPRAHVAMRLLEAPSPPKPLAPPPPKAGGCAPLLRSTNKPQGAPCRPSPPKAGAPRLRRAARITREVRRGRQVVQSAYPLPLPTVAPIRVPTVHSFTPSLAGRTVCVPLPPLEEARRRHRFLQRRGAGAPCASSPTPLRFRAAGQPPGAGSSPPLNTFSIVRSPAACLDPARPDRAGALLSRAGVAAGAHGAQRPAGVRRSCGRAARAPRPCCLAPRRRRTRGRPAAQRRADPRPCPPVVGVRYRDA